MSRWAFFIGVALGLLTVAFFVTEQLIAPPPGVSEETVRQIKAGMNAREVQTVFFGSHTPARPVVESPHYWRWNANHGYAEVFFTDDGRVRSAHFVYLCPPVIPAEPEPSLLARLRSWLRKGS
jgi:hypothetical protein